MLPVRLLNWDEIDDEDDDDENSVDSGVPSSGRSRPGDGNDYDNGKGHKDTEGGEAQTREGNRTRNKKWTGMVIEDAKGKWRGKGKAMEDETEKGMGTVKGQVLLNKPQGEMISLVPLHYSWRRKCIMQTQIQMAN